MIGVMKRKKLKNNFHPPRRSRGQKEEEDMKEFHWVTEEERRAERAYIRRELAKDAEREDRDNFIMGLVLCIVMFLMVLPICF